MFTELSHPFTHLHHYHIPPAALIWWHQIPLFVPFCSAYRAMSDVKRSIIISHSIICEVIYCRRNIIPFYLYPYKAPTNTLSLVCGSVLFWAVIAQGVFPRYLFGMFIDCIYLWRYGLFSFLGEGCTGREASRWVICIALHFCFSRLDMRFLSLVDASWYPPVFVMIYVEIRWFK